MTSATTVLFSVLALAWAGLLMLRLFGMEGNRLTSTLVALTPHSAVAGVLLGGLALGLHAWWPGAVLLVTTLALSALLVARLRVEAPPAAGSGQPVRVLSVNLYVGRADPAAVVDLVRRHRVDVLSVQELTESAQQRLLAAGLAEELPYLHFELRAEAYGSGLAARYPLLKRDLAEPAIMAQPSALIDLLGRAEIEVVVVHLMPPVSPYGAANWRREMAGLPEAGQCGPLRVLAGDFNATLDHAGLRSLLRRGYRDAAAACGAGLRPTWPVHAPLPPMTLDHILVDARCGIADYRVLPVPGTDHRAVLVTVHPAPPGGT